MQLHKIILLYISLLAFTSHAQNSSAGGPPTEKQLIGFWKKVNHPNEDEINIVNPWPQKFQWFAFYKDGSFNSMMMDEDANYSAKDLNTMFKIFPHNQSPQYILNGQMLLITQPTIPDYQETWGVNLLAMDINELLTKGRLIMSLDDGAGNPIYYRILERVK